MLLIEVQCFNFGGMNFFYRLFYYIRADKFGIWFLMLIILLFMVLYTILTPKSVCVVDKTEFQKDLELYEAMCNNQERLPKGTSIDPNLASVDSLCLAGFPRNIAYNILRYREGGGRFFSVQKVKKMYGMNDSIFAEVKPFLVIKKQQVKSPSPKKRLQKGDTIELNRVGYDSLLMAGISSRIARNIINYRKKGGRFKKVSSLKKIYGMTDSLYTQLFPFIYVQAGNNEEIVKKDSIERNIQLSNKVLVDLNTVGYDTLCAIGFPRRIARNIIKYRKSGGQFFSSEAVMKIYGMNDTVFSLVNRYIDVAALEKQKRNRFTKQSKDSVVLKEHARKEVFIELNSADTSLLKNIRGVGSYFAQRIVRYRDALGGFYSIDQLKEVYGMRSEIVEKNKHILKLDTLLITKINVNIIGEKELVKHPYITFKEARQIVRRRSKLGQFRSVSEFVNDPTLKIKMIHKFKYYVTL